MKVSGVCMSSNFLNHHTLELMMSVLPYFHPKIQHSILILSKTEELLDTLSNSSTQDGLSAMSLNSSAPPKMEDVLLQIKSVGNKQEQEMIDNLTNLLRMQKLLASYRTFMDTKQKEHAKSGDNVSMQSSDSMMEFLLSTLSSDQKINFDTLNTMMQAFNQKEDSK